MTSLPDAVSALGSGPLGRAAQWYAQDLEWLPATGKVSRQGEPITGWGRDATGRTVAVRTASGVHPITLRRQQ